MKVLLVFGLIILCVQVWKVLTLLHVQVGVGHCSALTAVFIVYTSLGKTIIFYACPVFISRYRRLCKTGIII